jgi:hypothetical protein
MCDVADDLSCLCMAANVGGGANELPSVVRFSSFEIRWLLINNLTQELGSTRLRASESQKTPKAATPKQIMAGQSMVTAGVSLSALRERV